MGNEQALEGGGAARREVPDFRVDQFKVRASRFCVGIPVINENGRLLRQLEAMREAHLGMDIVVADGGSSDGSTAPELLRDLGITALLTKTGPGRLSAQLRMFFSYALDQGYDAVLTIDGNGKDGVEGLRAVRMSLDDGYDFVQGSRFIKGGHHANTPLDRLLGVRLLHAPILSAGARHWYTDTTNGLRGWSRQLLEDPRVAPFRDIFDTYNLHYYLAVRAPRLGYRVCETPATRVYPPGETPSKIHGTRARLALLAMLLRSVTGKYNPPSRA